MHERDRLLHILADAGASFAMGPLRGKTPVDELPHTLTEALAHPGNVSIWTGTLSGGLGAIDADADAGLYPEAWPALRNAIRIYRPDADRAKWVIRAPMGYQARGNWVASIDLLFCEYRAVVAGVHFAGSPYLWDGTDIPTLTADELDAIFTWRLSSIKHVQNVSWATVHDFTRLA